jgi:hypothetical protein
VGAARRPLPRCWSSHDRTKAECRMQKAAQSQVQARYKPGTSQVQARCKPGTCEVHARYKPGTSSELSKLARMVRRYGPHGCRTAHGATVSDGGWPSIRPLPLN